MKKLDRRRLAVLVDADNLELHARNAYHRVVDYRLARGAMAVNGLPCLPLHMLADKDELRVDGLVPAEGALS